jgi:phosphatidylinositol kinase/protein kinase (PI-3  family)
LLHGLKIRKYRVIPLSFVSGLIGWLKWTDTFNQVVKTYHCERGIKSDLQFHTIIKDLYVPSIPPESTHKRQRIYEALTMMQKLDVFIAVVCDISERDLSDIL